MKAGKINAENAEAQREGGGGHSHQPSTLNHPLFSRAALIDLGGPLCACRGRKTRGMSFCLRDYRRLPCPLRQALYSRAGLGYEQAYTRALEFLGLESPEMLRLAAREAESLSTSNTQHPTPNIQ